MIDQYLLVISNIIIKNCIFSKTIIPNDVLKNCSLSALSYREVCGIK